MIYLTPKYSVNYRGVWHNAGEKFEISSSDTAELSAHGVITEEKEKTVVAEENRRQQLTHAKRNEKGGRK